MEYKQSLIDAALATARRAALDAAVYIRERHKNFSSIRIQEKAGGELVTDVDRDVEQMIRRRLTTDFPSYDVWGEEEGLIDQPSSYRWYVDPIDGTGNFVRGDTAFSVSIALAHEETVLVGVILRPLEKDLWWATHRGGTFYREKKLRVNTIPTLTDAHVVWCGGHEQNDARREMLRSSLLSSSGTFEHIGSAALECVAVASGTASAYATPQIQPWDVAAGKLLITEAGGIVTNFSGKPHRLQQGDLLASNGYLHGEIMQILETADPRRA